MNFLLDTNVLSELVKREPNNNVVKWMHQTPQGQLHVSVLSLGEIYKGIEHLSQSRARKAQLVTWVEEVLLNWFENRILPVEFSIAKRWGQLQKQCPRTFPAVNLLLAATALQHGFSVVTRHVQDFHAIPGLTIVNPWSEPLE